MRGELQIRQSAGKKVKNRLAAVRLTKPTSPWPPRFARTNHVRRLALGSPYSKPSTAEDGLPHPASPPSPGSHDASIDRDEHPTQCGCRPWNRLDVDFLDVCDRFACARTRFLSAECSTDGNTVHSGQVATTTEAARNFQRSCGRGSDTPRRLRTPGNEIPRKNRPKKAQHRGT